jgi:hypothetical protein
VIADDLPGWRGSAPLVGVKRIGTILVAAVATALLAACQADQPSGAPQPTAPANPTTASASPSADASAGATPTPSASADTAVEFTVDGAGPYQLGAELAALQATPGLAQVATGGQPCPQITTARGTGAWGDVQLSFRDGTLYLAVNRSASIPTPSGAWLGTTIAQLKAIYKGIPGEDLARGTRKAHIVETLSGRGILFELDARGTVSAMTAGEASYLRTSWSAGKGFC